jgi:hypothetical protein
MCLLVEEETMTLEGGVLIYMIETNDRSLSLETMTWTEEDEVSEWSSPLEPLCLMSDKHSKLLSLTTMKAWFSYGTVAPYPGCPNQRNVSSVILTEHTESLQVKEPSCVMMHGETFSHAFSTPVTPSPPCAGSQATSDQAPSSWRRILNPFISARVFPQSATPAS